LLLNRYKNKFQESCWSFVNFLWMSEGLTALHNISSSDPLRFAFCYECVCLFINLRSSVTANLIAAPSIDRQRLVTKFRHILSFSLGIFFNLLSPFALLGVLIIYLFKVNLINQNFEMDF